MRKSFNTDQQPLLVIPPPDPEPVIEAPVSITNDEIFGNKSQVTLSIEEPVKKKRGQRGKDKKKRIKKLFFIRINLVF